jgi:hypothetical protein
VGRHVSCEKGRAPAAQRLPHVGQQQAGVHGALRTASPFSGQVGMSWCSLLQEPCTPPAGPGSHCHTPGPG